jgi:hypothetical protein
LAGNVRGASRTLFGQGPNPIGKFCHVKEVSSYRAYPRLYLNDISAMSNRRGAAMTVNEANNYALAEIAETLIALAASGGGVE